MKQNLQTLSFKIIILTVLLFQILHVSAESFISGRIIDKESAPVAGATVLLLNHLDSAYITGVTSDLDGLFRITDIKPNNYILSLSMIGYKKLEVSTEIKHNTTSELGDLLLEEDVYMLSAVTVTGKRSPMKIEPGKMTVNLSSALLSTDGNILDALRKLPGVIVQNDGTIILNGKSGANVLIDDKLTYLSGESLVDYLRSISTESVDNIELITQPSSKYDAAGNSGIINIQKKKTIEQGINISVSSGAERGKYNRWNENISLAFRHNKLSIHMDYSTYWGSIFSFINGIRNYLAENPPLMLDTEMIRKTQYGSHNLRTGINYDFSEKITIGTYLSLNYFNREKDEVSHSDFFINPKNQIDSTLTTDGNINYSNKNIMGGADILYKLSANVKWDASFNYQLFNQSGDQLLKSALQTAINQLNKDMLLSKTNGDIKIYNGETNLSYDLNDKLGMVGGVKSVFVNVTGEAAYKNSVLGVWADDNRLSSNFGYKENINAVYTQAHLKWSSQFSSEIGLRIENTNIENSYNSNGNDSVLQKNYTHIFPTIMGQYQVSDNHSFSVLYGRRIVRPNYRDLNPFIEINNRYLYDKGNTELKPELIDNIEFSYLLNKQYMFNLFYSGRKDPISRSYIIEDDNKLIVMPLNLKRSHSFGLRVGLNNLEVFGWWTTNINSSLIYNKFLRIESNGLFENKIVTPMLHINNQLSLPFGWKMEIMGFYTGYMADGHAKIHPLGSVSGGFHKNLFKDKLSLYIYANDIFNSNQQHIDMQNNSMVSWYKEQSDSRVIGMSISYRFNRGREIKKSQNEHIIEESKRINM